MRIRLMFLEGGAGDVLCATPAIRAAKRQLLEGERLVVATPWPAMLAGNPNVDVLLSTSKQDDWRNDTRLLWKQVRSGEWQVIQSTGGHPYACFGGRHITAQIAEHHLLEIQDKSLDYRPEGFELEAAELFCAQFEPPRFLIHNPATCNGAKSFYPEFKPTEGTWLQIGLPGERRIPWAKNGLGIPLRETCALFWSDAISQALLGDSVFAHVASCSPTNALVVWCATDPRTFGHEANAAITSTGWLGGSLPPGSFRNCDIHPCNGPIGPIGGLAPWMLDVDTGQKIVSYCIHSERRCVPSWQSVVEAFNNVPF